MTWKEKRDKMDTTIKEIVVPFLRERGFKGSYPHFRRENGVNLNLLTFQFGLSAPQFVVEISNCPSTGFTTSWGKYLKPAQCRASYMNSRLRIGSLKNNKNTWYNFEKESLFSNIYKKKANEVLQNWEEGEQWWLNNPFTI